MSLVSLFCVGSLFDVTSISRATLGLLDFPPFFCLAKSAKSISWCASGTLDLAVVCSFGFSLFHEQFAKSAKSISWGATGILDLSVFLSVKLDLLAALLADAGAGRAFAVSLLKLKSVSGDALADVSIFRFGLPDDLEADLFWYTAKRELCAR